jgi:hypothetical protein
MRQHEGGSTCQRLLDIRSAITLAAGHGNEHIACLELARIGDQMKLLR